MIPKAHITAWRARAPWLLDAQVEQDLIISRAIVDLFRVPEIADALVFRGGTALYKLYLDPPVRYSEDIDLVQARSEPIGDSLDRARAVLDPWLGVPRRILKEGRVSLVYRVDSEDAPPLKLASTFSSSCRLAPVGTSALRAPGQPPDRRISVSLGLAPNRVGRTGLRDGE